MQWRGAVRLILAIGFILSAQGALTSADAQTIHKTSAIRPKVIVVVYFEVGKDTGDTPGELQF